MPDDLMLTLAEQAAFNRITMPSYRGPFDLPEARLRKYVLKIMRNQPIDDFLRVVSEPNQRYRLSDIRSVLEWLHETTISVNNQYPVRFLQHPQVLQDPHAFYREHIFKNPTIYFIENHLYIDSKIVAYLLAAFQAGVFYGSDLIGHHLVWSAMTAGLLSPLVLTTFVADACYKKTSSEDLRVNINGNASPYQEAFTGIFNDLKQQFSTFGFMTELATHHRVSLHRTPSILREPAYAFLPIAAVDTALVAPFLYPVKLLGDLAMAFDPDNPPNIEQFKTAAKFTAYFLLIHYFLIGEVFNETCDAISSDLKTSWYLNFLFSTLSTAGIVEGTGLAIEAGTRAVNWVRGHVPYLRLREEGSGEDLGTTTQSPSPRI